MRDLVHAGAHFTQRFGGHRHVPYDLWRKAFDDAAIGVANRFDEVRPVEGSAVDHGRRHVGHLQRRGLHGALADRELADVARLGQLPGYSPGMSIPKSLPRPYCCAQ